MLVLRVWGLWLRVQGSGFSGFKVQGLRILLEGVAVGLYRVYVGAKYWQL